MQRFRTILTVFRWLLGGILIGMLIWNPMSVSVLIGKLFPNMDWGSAEYTVVIHVLIAVGTAIVAVICLKDILVEWVSYPIRNFFSNIFFPNEKVIPPPNYNVAALYREQDRLTEALEVYLGILKHHPQEVLAYVDGIQTAFDASEPETAAHIAELASRVTEENLRQHITAIYEEARQEYELRPVEPEQEVVQEPEGELLAEESAELPAQEGERREPPVG